MPSQEKPIGVAITVCEKVIIEEGTKNKTLVSLFNSIRAKSFPCRHDRMSVYVALTNGQSQKQIGLILKDITTEATNMKLAGSVHFDNPNQVVELIFNLRSIVFAKPGTYTFEVQADGEYIFESRFSVIQLNPNQP